MARPDASDAGLPARYEIVGMVASGGTSEVLHVRDSLASPSTSDGGRDRALKILQAAWARQMPERFRDEFRILASLRHPGLARVFDFGFLGDGRPYYTSELVAGATLSERAGTVTVAEAYSIVTVLCRVLDLLGERGLLHNDVKPSNIILLPSGEGLKLVDFGLAGPVGQAVVGGTLPYASPERLRGEAPDQRSDLYALGVTIYRALTGVFPFSGETASEILASCAAGFPSLQDLRPDCPASFDALVRGLCAFDRGDRPARAADILEAMAASGLGHFPLEAPGTGEAYALSSTFIGRESEAATLAAAVEGAGRPGAPALTVVLGAAGHGKSRLLAETKRRVQMSGREAFQIRCPSQPAALAPIRELIRFGMTIAGDDEATRIACGPLGPLLADAGSDAKSELPPSLSNAERKDRLVLAAAATLAAAARVHPLALFVDDVDLADDATLEVVDALDRLSGAQSSPLSMTLAIRQERMSASLLARIADWEDRGRAIVVRLGPLRRDLLRRLLDSVWGRDVFGDADADWILDRSAGNPMVVVELLRALFERGSLVHHEGHWRLRDRWQKDAALAHGSGALGDLLASRLAGLSDAGSRRVVDALAVLRGPATPAVIAETSGLSTSEIEPALARLRATGLLVVEGDRLALFHESFADVALARLSESSRRALHRRAAEALARADAPSSETARQLVAAGEPRGFDAALDAADRAVELDDFRSAFRLLEDAGPLADAARAQPGQRRRMHEARGDCLAVLETVEAAEKEYLLALETRPIAAADVARVAGKAARAFVQRNRQHDCAAWIARSAETGVVTNDLEMSRLMLLHYQGEQRLLYDACNRLIADLGARRRSAEGRSAGARAQDAHLRREVEVLLVAACTRLGLFDEARVVVTAALAEARSSGALFRQAKLENNLAALEATTGRLTEAVAHMRTSLELLTLLGRLPSSAMGLRNLGEVLALLGDVAASGSALRDSIAMQRRIHGAAQEATALLGVTRVLAGDLDGARAILEEVGTMPEGGSPFAWMYAAVWLCVLDWWQGRADAVTARAAEIQARAQEGPGQGRRPAALWAQALAASVGGDVDAALAQLGEARAVLAGDSSGDSAGSFAAEGGTLFLSAEILRRAGRTSEARAAYASAARALAAIGSPVLATRVSSWAEKTMPGIRRDPPSDSSSAIKDPTTRLLELTLATLRTGGAVAAGGMVGDSPAMRDVGALVKRLARQSPPVLLLGESGTGKELLARALHDASPRAKGPFIAVNCAAIPTSVADAELFGHVRGAFTGAHEDRLGLFQQAHGGTVFLDELGEMEPAVQAKLLRVLEEREVRPLGGQNAVPIDIRLVSASNRDLRAEADAGRFRLDLYYRVAAFEISLPPLRERLEDLPLLVRRFLRGGPSGGREARKPTRIAQSALAALCRYGWPGNIRELQNELQRAEILAGDGPIRIEHLSARLRSGAAAAPPPSPPSVPPTATDSADKAPLRSQVAESERAAVVAALAGAGGNRSKAARALGVSRSTLYLKLIRYGLT